MSLKSRLKRLEMLESGSGLVRCPECGAAPRDPRDPVKFVLDSTEYGQGWDGYPEPLLCWGCGRVLKFTLKLGDAGPYQGGRPLMPRCRATKGTGEACKATATGQHGYCWAHAPENAEQRRRQASKAAKARPNREIKHIKSLCEDLTQQVLSGDLLPGPAAVANQLINTRLRAIEAERKLRETEELEERLEDLERAAEQRKGDSRWGA